MVATVDAWSRLAVTVAEPPSTIDDDDSDRVTVGTSSSTISSFTGAGSAIPREFAALPDTVTIAFPSWSVLTSAPMVTVPVLEVLFAAIVSLVPVCVWRPDGPDDETVIVVGSGDAWLKLAVTSVKPPSSIREADSDRVTSGTSLSTRFTVAVAGLPAVTPDGNDPKLSDTLSPSSCTLSSVAVTVNVAEVEPLEIVTSFADRA